MAADRERRVTQPLCMTCKHPRSFHGDNNACKALGCGECKGYVSPIAHAAAVEAAVVEAPKASTKRAAPEVRPGQVWADNDPRSAGRTVRIESIDISGDEPVAICTVLSLARNVCTGMGSIKKIKVRRFRPVSSGYVLVTDA